MQSEYLKDSNLYIGVYAGQATRVAKSLYYGGPVAEMIEALNSRCAAVAKAFPDSNVTYDGGFITVESARVEAEATFWRKVYRTMGREYGSLKADADLTGDLSVEYRDEIILEVAAGSAAKMVEANSDFIRVRSKDADGRISVINVGPPLDGPSTVSSQSMRLTDYEPGPGLDLGEI